MRDRAFLIWLHDRLEQVHGEPPLMDYMHKLRSIIYVTPKGQNTSDVCCDDMDELRKKLGLTEED